MESDTNSVGHNKWFHFMVSNNKKNQTVKFRIINFNSHTLLIREFCSKSKRELNKSEKGWEKNVKAVGPLFPEEYKDVDFRLKQGNS